MQLYSETVPEEQLSGIRVSRAEKSYGDTLDCVQMYVSHHTYLNPFDEAQLSQNPHRFVRFKDCHS